MARTAGIPFTSTQGNNDQSSDTLKVKYSHMHNCCEGSQNGFLSFQLVHDTYKYINIAGHVGLRHNVEVHKHTPIY